MRRYGLVELEEMLWASHQADKAGDRGGTPQVAAVNAPGAPRVDLQGQTPALAQDGFAECIASTPYAAPRALEDGIGAAALGRGPACGEGHQPPRGGPLFLDTWEQVEKTKPHAGCSPIRTTERRSDGTTRKRDT